MGQKIGRKYLTFLVLNFKKINVFCMRMVHQASESSLSSLPGLSCDKDLHHTWGQGHVLWSARQARPKHILYQQVVPAKKYGIFKQTQMLGFKCDGYTLGSISPTNYIYPIWMSLKINT